MTWKLRVFVFRVQVSLSVPRAPRVATCVRLGCSHSHFIFSESHSSEDVEKPKEKMEVNQQPGYLHWGPIQLEAPYPGGLSFPSWHWPGPGPGLPRPEASRSLQRGLVRTKPLSSTCPARGCPQAERPRGGSNLGKGIGGTCFLSAFIQCLPRSSLQTSHRAGSPRAGSELQAVILQA